MPVCHELLLSVALQGTVPQKSRGAYRGAEDKRTGRTDCDQADPRTSVAAGEDEQAT